MWVLSYSCTCVEIGKGSATHIKYNLLDLIKMVKIKSQNVKTHTVFLYEENVIWAQQTFFAFMCTETFFAITTVNLYAINDVHDLRKKYMMEEIKTDTITFL